MQDTDFLQMGAVYFAQEQHGLQRRAECVFGELSISAFSGDFTALDATGFGDIVDIYFVSSGQIRDPRSGALLQGDGSVVVIPGGRGLQSPFVGHGDAQRIRIQRGAAETFVPHALDSVTVTPVRSRLDDAAEAFIGAILNQPSRHGSAIELYATEQILLELTGSLLLDHCGVSWASNSVTSVLRDQAMAVIAQRSADRELNPEAVAKAVQSSLRRVQAAFAEVGNSIAAEIRRQRGRLAKSLLTDARYDVLSVQQIAEQTGFGTTAALRRALDELYGCGPRDLRERRVSDSTQP
ncbi:AraC-like DNA-binding protein [Paenarthrobacter nitroguajacolicus]|uniref:helix-turn-helix domain-containing protein n=1 Tax=Paenarthrobacter TaxID=1742992 RepID=UPI002854CB85|nr:helix-turn-helix domain-containing protein [Paenarthrobacter nitroguajacolicus]MDR6987993.1 AraC-like DNA-binding protein [Paenarthrobacter nitroguajacolicus]